MLQRDQFCQESNLSSEKKRNARNYIYAKIDRISVFRKKVSPGTGKVYKWFQFDNLSERSLQSAPRAAFPVDFAVGGCFLFHRRTEEEEEKISLGQLQSLQRGEEVWRGNGPN